MKTIFKYVTIIITIISAVMVYWHWNDHEVSAWIVAFTGWFNYMLDFLKEAKNEQV